MPKSICNMCGGTGYGTLFKHIECTVCSGTGGPWGNPCRTCYGRGTVAKNVRDSRVKCGPCRGEGYIRY